MTNKLTWIIGDEWQGIYINHTLKCEGHLITPEEICLLINIYSIQFSEIKYFNTEGNNWLNDEGSLPIWMSDISNKYFN